LLAIVGLIVVALVALDLVGIRRLVPLSEGYDWLAFLGALLGGIVGGLFTFGGVSLTLRQQRESDRQLREAEDTKNRLALMPLFEYKVSYDPADFDNSSGQLAGEPGIPIFSIDGGQYGDPDSLEFLFDIVVYNIGLGHALVTNLWFTISDNFDNTVFTHQGGYTSFLIKRNSRRDMRHYIYAPRIHPRFAGDPRQHVYNVEIIVGYEDLLGNKYEQKLHMAIAKSLYADEDPATGGSPTSSFHYADPPQFPAASFGNS